jgi:excisionase family DNA binding protein
MTARAQSRRRSRPVFRKPADPIDQGKILFTTDEAARLLSISEKTLFNLTRDGQIKATRLGRAVRYSRQAIDDMIERTTEKGNGR